MKKLKNFAIVVFIITITAFTSAGCAISTGQQDQAAGLTVDRELKANNIFGDIKDTGLGLEGQIMIANVGEYDFDPANVKTVREDIFVDGHFSIFDILVYLDNSGDIDMEYHFEEDLNTHVIDSINDIEYWWHIAYYDGGWPERNVFRVDHYPYKDRMYISIVGDEKEMLDRIYDVFRDEITRKNKNGGKTIIPEVIIRAPGENLLFENVEVTSHDLRSDIFKSGEGIITAIDAIMSLGDQGKLYYDLQWYESIGSAGIVKDYWVERINENASYSRCGFVYEAGSYAYEGFIGNHIHIPSDIRIINSPEYIEFFWICI